MKKILILLLAMMLLTSCQKDSKGLATEIVEEKPEIISEEKLSSIQLKSGDSIDFDELSIDILHQDIQISAPSLTNYKLDYQHSGTEDLMNALSSMSLERTTDIGKMYASALSEGNMFIHFDDDKRIELIESTPDYHNIYQYNYYENDEFAGYLTTEINLQDKIFEIDIENYLRNENAEKKFVIDKNILQVYSINLVERFFKGASPPVVLANIFNENFSFENGIFNGESGFAMPGEFRYELTPTPDKPYKGIYKLSEFIPARDGSEFGESVKEMARGNEEVFKKLISSQNSYEEVYDHQMNRLSYLANFYNLENYSHKINEIPGYENDVVYIEDGPNHIPGTVEIAKKEDYENAKRNIEGVNWPHCEGVIYHHETGIAVKTFIDYFQ